MREASLFYFQTMQNSIGKIDSTVIFKKRLLVDISSMFIEKNIFLVDILWTYNGHRRT